MKRKSKISVPLSGPSIRILTITLLFLPWFIKAAETKISRDTNFVFRGTIIKEVVTTLEEEIIGGYINTTGQKFTVTEMRALKNQDTLKKSFEIYSLIETLPLPRKKAFLITNKYYLSSGVIITTDPEIKPNGETSFNLFVFLFVFILPLFGLWFIALNWKKSQWKLITLFVVIIIADVIPLQATNLKQAGILFVLSAIATTIIASIISRSANITLVSFLVIMASTSIIYDHLTIINYGFTGYNLNLLPASLATSALAILILRRIVLKITKNTVPLPTIVSREEII